MSEPRGQAAVQEDKLPFDPRTFLLGLWRRRRVLAALALISALLGVLGGFVFGKRVYEAETVLLYKPTTDAKNLFAVPTVNTYMNMVKIQSSLGELNRRLSLESTTQALALACDVEVEKNSDLMIIRAQWSTASQAAAIANALREIFLESQETVRKAEASKQVHDLEGRLQTISRQLKQADQALHEFTTANKVISLDKESQKYLDQLTSIDTLYETAQIEKATIETKAANLDKIQADLRRRAEKEQADAAAETQKLYELNIRLERLRDAIHEDQSIRAANAELAQKEVDLAQAKQLKDKGVVSELEYQRAKNAYEKQKALAVDTVKVKQWRDEMDKLHETVLPTKPDSTSSLPVLRDIMLKAFDIQLERTSVAEKVKNLEGARNRVREKLESLPKLQRQFVELSREVTSREAEKQTLENLLVQARRVYESESADFGVVSTATPPVKPTRSSRRLLFLAITCLCMMLGFTGVVGLELMDTTIKSAGEFKLKLSLPLISVIPEISGDPPAFPDKSDFVPLEPFKLAARRARNAVPKKGARFLIVSADPGEGRTVAAANLAACLGRQDERVLLIDTQLRQPSSKHELRSLIPQSVGAIKGLGEFLSYEADKAEEVVWPTFLPGVECLPMVGAAAVPEFLGSNRMRELLENVSGRYSVVLMDVLPVSHYADAESLALWADAVIFVVRSRRCRVSRLRGILDRLAATKTPVVGAILNAVDPLYL